MALSVGFIGLLLVNIIGCSVYSVVAPYVPVIAESKGVSSTYMGLILCLNPAGALITSMFLSKDMAFFGRKRLLLFGCILASCATMAYSILPDTSYAMFMIIAFSMRLLQGVALGCIVTPMLTIIAINHKGNLQEALGYLQVSIGLGFLLGPLGASLLFSLGGYSAIFIAYGAMFLAFVPFFHFTIEDDEPQDKASQIIPSLVIFKDSELVLYFLAQFAGNACISYIFPTLSMHLEKLSVPESLFGVSFAIPTVTFIISTLLVVHSPFDKKNTTIFGIGLLVVSNLLLGPWEYTYLPRNFTVCVIALVIFGLGICASKLPSVTLILELANERYSRKYDSQSISDLISGVLNSVSFLAEIVAPPVSGLLTDSFGFENAQAMLAGSLAVLCVALIIDRIRNPVVNKKNVENKELLERLSEN